MGLDTKNDSKEKFLKEIVSDISKILVALDKIPVKLDNGTQELIEKIKGNFEQLNISTYFKFFCDEKIIKDALDQLKNSLQELPAQLKQLPYSDRTWINNLCDAINTILSKFADFFMNGPLVSEGVYIGNTYTRHDFKFFHLSNNINPSVADLSDKLSFSSKNS